MPHLIDKDALAAEIKRLKSIQLSIFSKGETIGRCYDSLTCISVYNEILSFIDSLEVKEVDLKKEIKMFSMNLAMKENNGDWEKDIAVTAKHFFELGIKAQKKEEV